MNVYSQNGEDGIVRELLSLLAIDDSSNPWCVEFGAWDGKHLSNTFNLVESASWNAVLVEGDPQKFTELELMAQEFPRVHAICSMVGGVRGSGSSLDDLLTETACPTNYDLLSVDIDSSDLDVWARHVDFRPKIVIIEINSTIPPGILQWHSREVQGNSFSATLRVAESKGYTLVCHTGNLIFVTDELAGSVGLEDIDRMFPERLFLWDWVESDRRIVRNVLRRSVSRLPLSVRKVFN
jgi:hypothetical protein